MKEPKGHEPYVPDASWCAEEVCEWDDQPWPCPTWQKWTGTNTYRVQMLEEERVRLTKAQSLTATELRETKERLRRLELLVRAGVMRAVFDGRRDVSITERVERDVTSVALIGEAFPTHVSGPEEYVVEYTDSDGTVWRNDRPVG